MQQLNLQGTTFDIMQACISQSPHPFGELVFNHLKRALIPSGKLSALFDKYIPGLSVPGDILHDEKTLQEAYSLWASIESASRAIFEREGMTERKRARLGLSDVFRIWARLGEETRMLRFSQRLHRFNHQVLACELVLTHFVNIPLEADMQSKQDKQMLERAVFPASEQLVSQNAYLLEAAGFCRDGSLTQQRTNEDLLALIQGTTSQAYRDYHRFEDIMLRVRTVRPGLDALLCVPQKIMMAQHKLQEFSRLVRCEYPKLAGNSAAYENEFVEIYLIPLRLTVIDNADHISKITAWGDGIREPAAQELILGSRDMVQRLQINRR
ncbi:hypothetical protein DFP73DRAFT_635250 [Morchella snyderi]|nr:hypothetical protein DFP73DRAFT_635250 [Morchella snyderi]